MEKKIVRNLTYNGTMEGTLDVSGHVYNRVMVNGELSVSGDLDCNRLVVNGSFSDKGILKAKSGLINGEAIVEGGLGSDRLSVNGQAEIEGNADVKELKIRGTTNVKGSIISEKIDLLGNINVTKDCNSGAFISKGIFVIGGLLNADRIDINLFGKCRVKEIGGGTIRIQRIRKALFNRVLRYIVHIVPEFDFEGQLTTETIEGDEIYAEYTSAKTVRGNNVTIGKGCDIGIVEYKNSFEQDKTAQVRQHLKV